MNQLLTSCLQPLVHAAKTMTNFYDPLSKYHSFEYLFNILLGKGSVFTDESGETLKRLPLLSLDIFGLLVRLVLLSPKPISMDSITHLIRLLFKATVIQAFICILMELNLSSNLTRAYFQRYLQKLQPKSICPAEQGNFTFEGLFLICDRSIRQILLPCEYCS
jgi:hypothetical protein